AAHRTSAWPRAPRARDRRAVASWDPPGPAPRPGSMTHRRRARQPARPAGDAATRPSPTRSGRGRDAGRGAGVPSVDIHIQSVLLAAEAEQTTDQFRRMFIRVAETVDAGASERPDPATRT